jgi:hypothetical protein
MTVRAERMRSPPGTGLMRLLAWPLFSPGQAICSVPWRDRPRKLNSQLRLRHAAFSR